MKNKHLSSNLATLVEKKESMKFTAEKMICETANVWNKFALFFQLNTCVMVR